MHTLEFSFLILSLLLSSFHGKFVNGDAFNLQSGQLQESQFKSLIHASVVDGNLSLDASTGDAQAFYSTAINFLDSGSLHSFSSLFTFSSNVTNGNGTIAFVLTPDDSAVVSLEMARKTFTLEFNTSCSGNGSGFDNGPGNWGPGDGRGFGPGNWGGNGGGFFDGAGLGGFKVVEYANSTSITAQNYSGYGPSWNDQYNAPYFCTQQGSSPFDPANYPANFLTFQYQVVFEYNASTHTVSVGSPSCGGTGFARTTELAAEDLSGILTKPLYVGFIASGGGIYSISQWNFTSDATTNSVTSLALSTGTSTTPSSTSSGSGSGSGGSGWHSGRGLSKGAVIGFAILGGAIGIAAAFLVCCLCARRKRVTTTRSVATKSVHAGIIPESAVIFDARKPNAPPTLAERDTIPLNARPNSAFQASTGGASWLHPVAPR